MGPDKDIRLKFELTLDYGLVVVPADEDVEYEILKD